MFAVAKWVIYSINGRRTACTDVVGSGRMPLPPLDQPYALSDDPIADFLGASHQSMMHGDVRTLPAWFFAIFHSIVIPLFQVKKAVQLALNDLGFQDDGRAGPIFDDYLGSRANP